MLIYSAQNSNFSNIEILTPTPSALQVVGGTKIGFAQFNSSDNQASNAMFGIDAIPQTDQNAEIFIQATGSGNIVSSHLRKASGTGSAMAMLGSNFNKGSFTAAGITTTFTCFLDDYIFRNYIRCYFSALISNSTSTTSVSDSVDVDLVLHLAILLDAWAFTYFCMISQGNARPMPLTLLKSYGIDELMLPIWMINIIRISNNEGTSFKYDAQSQFGQSSHHSSDNVHTTYSTITTRLNKDQVIDIFMVELESLLSKQSASYKLLKLIVEGKASRLDLVQQILPGMTISSAQNIVNKVNIHGFNLLKDGAFSLKSATKSWNNSFKEVAKSNGLFVKISLDILFDSDSNNDFSYLYTSFSYKGQVHLINSTHKQFDSAFCEIYGTKCDGDIAPLIQGGYIKLTGDQETLGIFGETSDIGWSKAFFGAIFRFTLVKYPEIGSEETPMPTAPRGPSFIGGNNFMSVTRGDVSLRAFGRHSKGLGLRDVNKPQNKPDYTVHNETFSALKQDDSKTKQKVEIISNTIDKIDTVIKESKPVVTQMTADVATKVIPKVQNIPTDKADISKYIASIVSKPVNTVHITNIKGNEVNNLIIRIFALLLNIVMMDKLDVTTKDIETSVSEFNNGTFTSGLKEIKSETKADIVIISGDSYAGKTWMTSIASQMFVDIDSFQTDEFKANRDIIMDDSKRKIEELNPNFAELIKSNINQIGNRILLVHSVDQLKGLDLKYINLAHMTASDELIVQRVVERNPEITEQRLSKITGSRLDSIPNRIVYDRKGQNRLIIMIITFISKYKNNK